ncbi:partial Sensor histidine kinase LiaS, partial [Candidatus Brocadiaceae bacterium]
TERKRSTKLNQILQSFAIELAGAVTIQQATDAILKTLLETMDGQFSAIFRISEDRRRLERVGVQGLGNSYIHKNLSLLLEEDLPITEAVRTHQILWIRDQTEYLRLYPHLAEDIQELNIQGIICLPFFGSKGIVGGVHVTFTHVREIDQEERNFLFVVTQLCGQALERVHLYEKTEQLADQLWQLYTVTSALAQAATLEEVAYIAVDKTTSVLATASFHLYDEKAGTFELVYTNADLPPENLAAWQRYNADPTYPITTVVQTKAPLWFNSGVERESRYPSAGQFRVSFTGASALLPLMVQGQVLAVLSLSFAKPKEFSVAEQALASAIAQQCAQALKRVQLNEQAKQAIALEERQRFARDLHDSVSQTLYAATTLGESLSRLWERDPAQTLSMVEQVITLNRAALAEMRLLLWELRPEAILKSRLQDLFRHLLEAAQGRKAIGADLSIEGYDETLPSDVHIALYRITQESINNILKHSESSHFTVTFQQHIDEIRLEIADNGQGFNPTQDSSGLGLSSMRERAREIGATLDIDSKLGEGTTVKVIWPRNHLKRS